MRHCSNTAGSSGGLVGLCEACAFVLWFVSLFGHLRHPAVSVHILKHKVGNVGIDIYARMTRSARFFDPTDLPLAVIRLMLFFKLFTIF